MELLRKRKGPGAAKAVGWGGQSHAIQKLLERVARITGDAPIPPLARTQLLYVAELVHSKLDLACSTSAPVSIKLVVEAFHMIEEYLLELNTLCGYPQEADLVTDLAAAFKAEPAALPKVGFLRDAGGKIRIGTLHRGGDDRSGAGHHPTLEFSGSPNKYQQLAIESRRESSLSKPGTEEPSSAMLGPDEPCAGTSARTAGLMVSLWKAKQMWKKPLRSPRSHSARPGHDVLGINKDSSSQELGKPPLSPRPPSSPMTPFNARGDLTATLLVNANLQPRYQQQQSASTSALIAELSQKCTEIEKTRDLQRDLRDKRQQLGIEFLELKAAAQRQNADLQKENQELKDTIAGLQSDLDAKGRAVTDLRRGMYKEVCLLTQQVAALRRGEAAAKNGSVELGNVLSMLDLALTGLEEPKENELSKYADQEYRRILREINVDADNGAPLKAGAALLAKYKLQQTAKNARNAKAPPPSPTSKEPMRHLHPYYKLKVAEQTLKLLQQKYALDKRVWANRQAQLQQRIRAAVNERTGLFPKYFPQYLGKSTVTAGFRIRQLHLVEEHYYLMQDSVDILKGDFCVMSNTVHDALDGFRSEFAALTASLEQLSASARVDEAELARLSPYQELAVGIVTFFKPLSTYSGEPGSPHPWSYGNRRFPLDDYIGDSCGCEALRELRPLTAELHGIYYSIMKLLLPQLDSEDAESTRRSSRNLQSGIESLQQCELTPEEAENLRVVRDTDLSHASQIVCFNFQIGFALLRMQKMLSRLATANALQVAAVRVSVESTDCLLQTLRAKKAVLQKKRKTNAENIADLWMKVHASDDEPEYTTEGTQPFVLGRSSAIAAGAALLTSDSISEESGSNPGEALD